MTDLDDRVASIKARISRAQQGRARAEAELALAREHAGQAEQALWDEFSIRPSEVAAAISAGEADLAAEAARVEALLERAEASE